IAAECHQKRYREALGAQVSGIPSEPQGPDRSSAGKPRKAQNESAGEVAKLSEPNQQPTAGRLATVHSRLVGVLPTGRESPSNLPTGGMGPTAYPSLFLGKVARARRKRAAVAGLGTARQAAKSGAEFPGSLAFGRDRQSANRAQQPDTSTLWLSDAIGS